MVIATTHSSSRDRLTHLQQAEDDEARPPELSPSHRRLYNGRSADDFQSFLQTRMDQSDGGDEGFDWDRFQSHLVKPGAGVAFDAFRSTTLALTTNSSGLKVAETLRDRLQMNFSEELIKQLNETVERQTPQPISPNTLVAEAAQGSPQIVKAVREWRALLPLADCRGGDQCLLQALVMTLRRTDGDEKAVGEAPSAKSSQTVVINVKMMRVIASPDSEYKVDDGSCHPGIRDAS